MARWVLVFLSLFALVYGDQQGVSIIHPNQGTVLTVGKLLDAEVKWFAFDQIAYTSIEFNVLNYTLGIFDYPANVIQFVCSFNPTTGAQACPTIKADPTNPKVGIMSLGFFLTEELKNYAGKVTIYVRGRWNRIDNPGISDSLQQSLTVLVAPASDTPTPTPTPSTPSPTPTPGIFGDPHVRTLDGLSVTYVGCGDQTMLADTDDALMYQARHCTRGNEASSTCAVALRCAAEADVIELYATGTALKFLVGGREWTLPLSATFTAKGVKVIRERSDITLMCSSGVKIDAHLREAGGINYLDSFVVIPDTFRSKTKGLMGFWDDDKENDISYPDGKVWNAGHGLEYVSALEHPELDTIQAAWTVKAEESLFHLNVKQANAECSAHTAQQRRTMLAAKDDSLRVEGRTACMAGGLTGAFLETCVFDFIATNGNHDYVRNAIKNAGLM